MIRVSCDDDDDDDDEEEEEEEQKRTSHRSSSYLYSELDECEDEINIKTGPPLPMQCKPVHTATPPERDWQPAVAGR